MWQAEIKQLSQITDEGELDIVIDILRDGKVVASDKSLRTTTETYETDIIAFAKKLREARIKTAQIKVGTKIDLT